MSLGEEVVGENRGCGVGDGSCRVEESQSGGGEEGPAKAAVESLSELEGARSGGHGVRL